MFVDVPDEKNNTPLHYAAKYNNVDVCKILINRGANLLKKNNDKKTAYDVAEGHDIVRQYLLPLLMKAQRDQSGNVNIT